MYGVNWNPDLAVYFLFFTVICLLARAMLGRVKVLGAVIVWGWVLVAITFAFVTFPELGLVAVALALWRAIHRWGAKHVLGWAALALVFWTQLVGEWADGGVDAYGLEAPVTLVKAAWTTTKLTLVAVVGYAMLRAVMRPPGWLGNLTSGYGAESRHLRELREAEAGRRARGRVTGWAGRQVGREWGADRQAAEEAAGERADVAEQLRRERRRAKLKAELEAELDAEEAGGPDRPTGSEAPTATATVVDSATVTADDLADAADAQVAGSMPWWETHKPRRRRRRAEQTPPTSPDPWGTTEGGDPSNQRSCGTCGSGPGWHPSTCDECAAYQTVLKAEGDAMRERRNASRRRREEQGP